MDDNWSDLVQYWPDLVDGAIGTVKLTAASALLGTVLALGLTLARSAGPSTARLLGSAYVEVVRNTPFLVQLFFLYFGLATIGVRLSPDFAAVLALSLNFSAYMAEVVRAGLASVPDGQREAARALGLRPLHAYALVIGRPMLRAVYPSALSQLVLLLLTSSLVSAVSAVDLASTAAELSSLTFRNLVIYPAVAAVYLVLVVCLRRLGGIVFDRYIDFPVR